MIYTVTAGGTTKTYEGTPDEINELLRKREYTIPNYVINPIPYPPKYPYGEIWNVTSGLVNVKA